MSFFSGFAVHHLQLEEKARFFQAAGRSLSGSGWLLMADVVRETNQSRQDFLEGYLRFMRESWTQIPANELEAACAHVETYDYPEDFATLQRMAKASGLRGSQLIDRHGQHYTVLFSRNAVPQTGGLLRDQ